MRSVFAALFMLTISHPVSAQAPAAPPLKTINAITFGGGYNIPAWIAQRQGFFAKYGVAVNLVYTPDSVYLMTSLIEGKVDMALTSIAKKTYDIFVHPKSGLFRNLALDMEGVKTVLDLRSKYGAPQKTLGDPMKYVDLTLHQKAFGDVKQ